MSSVRGCRPFSFRFSECNPLTGEAFAVSRFFDLPGFAADVVTDQLRLGREQWDCLVEAGAVFEVAGHGLYGVPGSVVEVCGACRGDGRWRDSSGFVEAGRVCGRCGGAGEFVVMPTGKLDQVTHLVRVRSAVAA